MHTRQFRPVSVYLDAGMRAKLDRAAEAQGVNRTEYIRRVLALHLDQDAAVAPLPWRLSEVERRLRAIEASLGLSYSPDAATPRPLTGYTARPRAGRRPPAGNDAVAATATEMGG